MKRSLTFKFNLCCMFACLLVGASVVNSCNSVVEPRIAVIAEK